MIFISILSSLLHMEPQSPLFFIRSSRLRQEPSLLRIFKLFFRLSQHHLIYFHYLKVKFESTLPASPSSLCFSTKCTQSFNCYKAANSEHRSLKQKKILTTVYTHIIILSIPMKERASPQANSPIHKPVKTTITSYFQQLRAKAPRERAQPQFFQEQTQNLIVSKLSTFSKFLQLNFENQPRDFLSDLSSFQSQSSKPTSLDDRSQKDKNAYHLIKSEQYEVFHTDSYNKIQQSISPSMVFFQWDCDTLLVFKSYINEYGSTPSIFSSTPSKTQISQSKIPI